MKNLENLINQLKPKVSIIVLTVNQAKLTTKCFSSIKHNTEIPYEIIWVDNGSKHSEFETIYSHCMENKIFIKVLRFNENKGFVNGVNAAIPYISKDSKFVALLNNDTEVGPNTFEKLIIPLYDKKVGVTSCVTQSGISWQSHINLSNPKLWPSLKFPKRTGNTDQYTRELEKAHKSKCVDINSTPQTKELSFSFFCAAFRKEVFCDELKGLDPEIDNGLGDDDLACAKLRNAGYRLVLCLDAFVYHHHRTTFKELGLNIDLLRRKNIKVLRKYNHDQKLIAKKQ